MKSSAFRSGLSNPQDFAAKCYVILSYCSDLAFYPSEKMKVGVLVGYLGMGTKVEGTEVLTQNLASY